MSTRAWLAIIVVLAIIIVALTYLLLTTPAPVRPSAATSTTPTSSASTHTAPPAPTALHERIVITSPKSGATVGATFTVTGKVPGNWSFEAQFPIQVRDPDNNKIGQTVATLKGDWMTTALVPFTATMALDTPYHGPATLVLLRDNPSGMPENDDSLEVSILIK